MSSLQKRLLGFVLVLFFLLVALALLYMAGMRWLEGEPRGFLQSLAWAAETLTTTGYGADNAWAHPLMVLFVVSVQLVGVLVVFLVFPFYLIPLLEERFVVRVAREAPALDGHVLIYKYGAAVESLLEDLTANGVPFVVAESDEEQARVLKERKVSVFLARSEDEALAGGRALQARALVANGRDEENAGLILGARQMGYEREIIAFAEEPQRRKPLTVAGASAVFTPRHVLAAALAARASDRISPRLSGIQRIGRLEIDEIHVGEGSALAGKALAEAELGARTGATVVGIWVGGRLQVLPRADTVLAPRSILIAVGGEESLARIRALCRDQEESEPRRLVVVAGFGEVGKKVKQLLDAAGEEVFTVDRQDLPGVDLVGDVLDPEVLKKARLAQAKAVIVALDRDDLTLFTTVVVKDLAPEALVIARVNRSINIEKIHRAGADFARSISQVSAQILSRRLLGHEAVSLDPLLKLERGEVGPLAGRSPVSLDIRRRTGASVIAVYRGEEVIVEFGPDFAFREGDEVYLCGSDEALARYHETFQAGDGAEPTGT